MFGTLLESTRSRESKAGYTVMSVIAHAVLVAGAVVATTSAGDAGVAPTPPEVIDVIYTVPERRDEGASRVRRGTSQPSGDRAAGQVPAIDLPLLAIPPVGIPTTLPPIDAGALPTPGAPSIPGGRGDGAITGSYLSSDDVHGGVLTPDRVERTVALRTSVEPGYPSALRQSGVEGTVRVRFVVDTLGRVEPSSVEVRASAHDAFTEAVRAVLPRLRFAPARVAHRPVRQLVEMPFVFSLR